MLEVSCQAHTSNDVTRIDDDYDNDGDDNDDLNEPGNHTMLRSYNVHSRILITQTHKKS